MARKKRRHGGIPDIPDHRDHPYSTPVDFLKKLPSDKDLRNKCPPVYSEQGELGACTANAVAAALQFNMIRENLQDFVPSRLFIYYNARALVGPWAVTWDQGVSTRLAIKAVEKLGICPESEWPYDEKKVLVEPLPKCYKDAKKHKGIKYQRLSQDLKQMKGCLAEGYPFVCTLTVYNSFDRPEVKKTGDVPMPKSKERLLSEGAGHTVLAVGYNDSQGRFIARNSYGKTWGMKGYMTLPYEYLTHPDLTCDLWTIRRIS